LFALGAPSSSPLRHDVFSIADLGIWSAAIAVGPSQHTNFKCVRGADLCVANQYRVRLCTVPRLKYKTAWPIFPSRLPGESTILPRQISADAFGSGIVLRYQTCRMLFWGTSNPVKYPSKKYKPQGYKHQERDEILPHGNLSPACQPRVKPIFNRVNSLEAVEKGVVCVE
jgi:hypothetical protein